MKYIAKIPIGNGKYRYFYDPKEYMAYKKAVSKPHRHKPSVVARDATGKKRVYYKTSTTGRGGSDPNYGSYRTKNGNHTLVKTKSNELFGEKKARAISSDMGNWSHTYISDGKVERAINKSKNWIKRQLNKR